MPSEGMLCCRSTTVSMPCSPPSASDPLVASPVSATQRDLPVAEVEGEASAKRIFKAYPIGYFHIDIAEVRTAQGKLSLIVAIDRTSKSPSSRCTRRWRAAPRGTPARPDRRRPLQGPYRPHRQRNPLHHPRPYEFGRARHQGRPRGWRTRLAHAFEYACAQNDIDHRLTKPKPPWTNGQVERMNRTIKDATVKRDFYETHDQLRAHLQNFVAPIISREDSRPSRPHSVRVRLQSLDLRAAKIKLNPLQQMPGLNT